MSIKKIIVLTVVAGFIVSCNKLVEDPDSIIVSSQFYKTQSDAIAAVNAVYSTLNTDAANDFPIYGRDLNLLTGNGSDDHSPFSLLAISGSGDSWLAANISAGVTRFDSPSLHRIRQSSRHNSMDSISGFTFGSPPSA